VVHGHLPGLGQQQEALAEKTIRKMQNCGATSNHFCEVCACITHRNTHSDKQKISREWTIHLPFQILPSPCSLLVGYVNMEQENAMKAFATTSNGNLFFLMDAFFHAKSRMDKITKPTT
jgi:hypothetical protein